MDSGVRAGRNGGQLKTGNPGNKGGGRRPDHIRAVARESLALALGMLDDRLRDPEFSTAELLRALDLFLRYGIGPALPESLNERPMVPMSESLDTFLLNEKAFAALTGGSE